MKIPAIMYILIGLLSGKPTGKYIGGSVAIMVLAIVVDVICKRYSTVLQTEEDIMQVLFYENQDCRTSAISADGVFQFQ